MATSASLRLVDGLGPFSAPVGPNRRGPRARDQCRLPGWRLAFALVEPARLVLRRNRTLWRVDNFGQPPPQLVGAQRPNTMLVVRARTVVVCGQHVHQASTGPPG